MDASAAQLGQLLVVDREEARGVALPSRVSSAQDGVPAAQHSIVILRLAEIFGRALEDRAIQERASLRWCPAGDGQVLRREQDDLKAAEVARGRPDCLSVKTNLTSTRRERQLVGPHRAVSLDGGGQACFGSPELEELGQPARAERPQRADDVDRLEEVRLPLPVRTGEDVEAGPWLEGQRSQVAKPDQLERAKQQTKPRNRRG